MSWLKNNPWKTTFILFFLVNMAASLLLYKNYGISIDEPIQHQHLLISAKKIFSTLGILENAPQSIQSAPDLATYEHKFYGVAAQYPLLILEFFPQTFSPNLPAFWFARHLYTRIIFLLGGVAFFLIAKKATKNNLIILLALMAYFLNPRISAHSFYNIKDSIFLSLFVISMYFLFKYLETRKIKDLALLACISAITVNVRLMGILIPAFLGFWLFVELLVHKNFAQNFKTLVIFGLFFGSILYFIWPALWGTPRATLIDAFSKFANYDWDGRVLFAGRYVSAKSPPRLYLPVWIAVSNPWLHLVFWVFGLFLPVLLLIKKSCQSHLERPYIFVAAHFFIWASFLPIVTLGSTLYSGWRHVHYLFGPFMILFVYSLDLIWKRFSAKFFSVVVAVAFLFLGHALYWMVSNHPFEYAYFNKLAGKSWSQNWEHDYWWVSSKQLLEFLVTEAQNRGEVLTFCSGNSWHVPINMQLLALDERELIRLDCSMDYAFYLHNSNTLGEFNLSGFRSVYEVRIGKEVLSTVYERVD